jgi:hypothetical protein
MDYDPAAVAELYRLWDEHLAPALREQAALADIENRLWRWFPEIAAQKAAERGRVEERESIWTGEAGL